MTLGEFDATAASSDRPAGRPWRLLIGETGRGPDDVIPIGTAVMVKTQYLGSWATGFVVSEQLEDGYRLQRLSDGSHMPGLFGRSSVRPIADLD